MAYSFKVTPTWDGIGADRVLTLVIDETEAGAADEWTFSPIPTFGTITLKQHYKSSGSATQMGLRLGKVSGWSDDTPDEINHTPAGDEYLFDNDPTAIAYDTRDQNYPGILHGSSAATPGADNTIRTILTIRPGHPK